MSESVVLCEGFHDRAFWDGWLTHLGCNSDGFKPGTSGYPARDPWNLAVTHGQFAYRSASRNFVRVRACKGKTHVVPEARIRLGQRNTKALVRLVLNVDPDSDPSSAATGLRHQDVLREVQSIESSAKMNADNEIEIDGGATKIHLVRWETTDAAGPGLPNQQTLERLICSAIIAAYPARAKAVQDWLDTRPTPPVADPKEHAWSHMAGWYADMGCEAFFSNLWNDARIASELKSRLQSSGAWRIAELLAS
jgi:hypothetical protein